MRVELQSPCKVNLVLNILGKRPDGFHELETVMQPVPVCDTLTFEQTLRPGIELTCDQPALPADSSNLVWRAANRFLDAFKISGGVHIHLEKRIPLAAGLGGGSGNAASTLLGLNELFGRPLSSDKLQAMAAALGSDVPFFLQARPALALGRGEQIQRLSPFRALSGAFLLLIHPGFGIATAWAYRNLARFPGALSGQPGRAAKLVALLNSADLRAAGREFYNSLEAPAFEKYPIVAMYQEFLREHGAAVALMSGSGSTTFAVFEDREWAEQVVPIFQRRFGPGAWTALVPMEGGAVSQGG